MSDYLPEEILIEVLVKLPVKSLIRATSVCKQWRYLIRSPSFISTHLSITENQALLQRYDYLNRQEHYTLIPKGGPFDIRFSPEYEVPFGSPHSVFKIVGSCDGLVCLSDSQRIIIWNPAIRNHVVLPQPLVNPSELHRADELEFGAQNESHRAVLGFGVASNVYKVVRLVYCLNPNGNGFIVPPQAEIFCLGTGRWRKLSGFEVGGSVPKYLWCPIFFEGFVHWIAYDPIGGRSSILRFHVGDEVFGEIMLPDELERVPVGTRVSLSMMGKRLGAFKSRREVGKLRCDVWMIKDYGVKESWTKLYRIDTLRYMRVIGFWGCDEVVLGARGCEVVTYNPETKTYNPETKGIKHVEIFGYISSFYVDDYKESLVLLGGYSGNSGEGLSRGATCSIES